ncbi:MAG: class I SAM-dependent methyltransferase [Candidatus Lokiarchaeota archaeon]|nr:class I SAM-dependent methyltransferase [Candidatus Lokiarchaeota archaeon]
MTPLFTWKKRVRFYDIQSQLALPYAPTPEVVIQDAFSSLEMGFGLSRGSNQTFIDLGAGTGQIVMYCARTYKIASYGIEINDGFVRIARKAIRREKLRNATVFQGDLFTHDIGQYDFVFIYTLPPVQKFLNHVFETAHRGAIIFTYKYPLDELSHLLALRYEAQVDVDGSPVRIYFYERK